MKKGFTLIELMIVVAIIAILAMIAVPMYQRYIERSRNSASQSMLQQIALAQVALDTAPENPEQYQDSDLPGISLLAGFGFRPDQNVAIDIQATNLNNGGFIAFAGHIANGSQIFVYDNQNASGVVAWDGITPGNLPGGTRAPAFSVFTWDAGTSSATVARTCNANASGSMASCT